MLKLLGAWRSSEEEDITVGARLFYVTFRD
jgi:hypothetical protein